MKEQKISNVAPIVEVDNVKLSDNYYTRDYKSWCVANLLQYAKEKAYPIFDLPLAGVSLDIVPFRIDTMRDLLFQMKRVEDCDLQYPIILDELGLVADGNHRVLKAMLRGDRTIKAIRLQEMPTPDSETEITNG